MYNSKWDRWIYASVSKYFNDNKGDYALFFEGHDYDENAFNDAKKRVEFRMDGPAREERARDDWVLDFEVNLFISVTRSDSDVHTIYTIAGYIQSLFKNNIPIYKYGDGGALLGCLTLISEVKVSQLGQVEERTVVLQATVEGHYRIYLET